MKLWEISIIRTERNRIVSYVCLPADGSLVCGLQMLTEANGLSMGSAVRVVAVVGVRAGVEVGAGVDVGAPKVKEAAGVEV